MTYIFLAIAICAEVFATTMLKVSANFTRITPLLLCISGYGVSFYALSHVLRFMSTGVAYAIWSGVGIVLISLVSWLVFRQTLDFAALLGLFLIIAGVVVVNIFSKSVAH